MKKLGEALKKFLLEEVLPWGIFGALLSGSVTTLILGLAIIYHFSGLSHSITSSILGGVILGFYALMALQGYIVWATKVMEWVLTW